MTYTVAKKFWSTYLKLANTTDANITMSNPGIIFCNETKSGKNDSLSDEEFHEKEQDTLALATFWQNNPTESAQKILMNAIATTDLSDNEIDLVAETLAFASERSSYYYAGDDYPEDPTDIVNTDLDFDPSSPRTPAEWTPRQIYDYLCQHIYGQEEAKRAVSMLMYNHLHGRSRNIVMIGDSGCGKTETWRALSKIYSCIRIINGPQLTGEGWSGSMKISDIFNSEPKQIAERLIIVIDEADKAFEAAYTSGGNDASKIIQNELLKLMDGDVLTFFDNKDRNKKTVIDCSRISVVLCGSFESMRQAKAESHENIGFGRQERKESTSAEFTEEDLVCYANVRREIASRICRIVKFDAMNADDFEAILDSPASPIRKIEEMQQVSLSINKDTRKKLAYCVAESQLDCRYIRSKLQNMLDQQVFDNPNAMLYELSLA